MCDYDVEYGDEACEDCVYRRICEEEERFSQLEDYYRDLYYDEED